MLKKNLIIIFSLACLFSPVPGLAAGSVDTLTPLFGKIIGWRAQKAMGVSQVVGGLQMHNASRSYNRGSKEVDAVLMVGANVMAYQGNLPQISTETADGSVRIRKINGFQVQSVFDKKEKAGSVIVFLARKRSAAAVFMLNYNGLSEGDGLDMAKKFSWPAMQAAVNGLL